MKQEFRVNTRKLNFVILYVFSLIHTTHIHKSIVQRKIIVISLGFFVLVTIPFLGFAFAADIPVGGGGTVSPNLVESLGVIFAFDEMNTVFVVDVITKDVIKTVEVGTTPTATEYVSSTSYLYVTNQADGTVTVIDVSTLSTAFVVTTITVGTGPFILSYNSLNEQMYVANSLSSSVSVIDVDSLSGTFNTVVKTISVGLVPTGIDFNVNTNKIYVGNTFGNTVSVIDGITDTVVSTVSVPSAGAVTVDTINNNIYVAQAFSNAVSVIDGSNDTVLQAITTGNGPRSMVYDSITDQMLALAETDDALVIIDANNLSVVGIVPLGFTPDGIDVSTASTVYIGAPGGVNILDLGSNIPPVANAGPDQTVDEGDLVTLDGSGSSDFNMDPLTFQWSQTKGASVVLSSSTTVESPTFTAPDVSGNTIFEFSLTVNDGLFDSIADLLTIVVKDVTTFVVTLSSVGGQLEGDVTIDDFPTDTQLTFNFVNPVGDAEGKLEDVKIASSISGSNVEFEFIANIEEPGTVPALNDPALYYEISNTVIDFSGTANFPSNYLPSSQFLIDKNYDAGGSFSDGCPVVFSLLLNESSNQWEIQGDPQIANTNKIYVVDSVGDQVFVVDGKTNEIITSISVGDNPRDSVFDPTLNKLYVTNLDSGTVSVINTLTNTVQATIPVSGAAAIDIDTATNKVYAANFGLGAIKVIDTNTDTIVDTITTSGTNLSAMAFSPNLQRLFIVDSNSEELITVDTVTKAEISSIAMGGIPTGMAINPNNDSVYIALSSTSEVLVVNGATNTIIERITVGSTPVGVGVNSLTNKVFVANLLSGTVSVIDSAINVEIDTITIGVGIVGLAVNENTDRVFVANIFTGTVSILDGSTHELLDTVTLAPDIFTITLNNLVSNPERDPSNDNLDSMTDEILECAYIAKLPHLSKFAIGGVKALVLGGVGGGSGNSAPIVSISKLITSTAIDVPSEIKQMVLNHDSFAPLLPMDPNSFEDFDFPLIINDQGFVLGGFTNTLQTQIIKINTPVTMKFAIYEGEKIQHFSMYMNLRDTNDSIPKSDTQILYNDGKELQVVDPNGFFSNTKITIIEEEDSFIKQVIVEMTFAKEMETSHIITRIWDPNLFSRDTHILDAIKVGSPEPEFIPLPQGAEEIQIEELKSEIIPKWVKSNAEWWVDNQIEDESFVAGIQYMINNGIMYVPNIENTNSVTKIPDWIKSNAEWWTSNQISDDDFVKSMEWLVTNGVITVE